MGVHDRVASSFSPSGVLTLTSDLGSAGPYVGVMQGVMLSRHPAARIVHLHHQIEVHWPAEAGFWLERAFSFFPVGTVHVAAVESGLGTDRPGLVVTLDGHAFVGPDNGLLAPLAERDGALTYLVTAATLRTLGVPSVAPTFRGRDVYAPIGGALAAGTLDPTEVGPRTTDWAPSLLDRPEPKGAEVVGGVVVSIDAFGNLITNIEAALVERLAPAEVVIGGRNLPVARRYEEKPPGELLAVVNGFGVVEVARAQQSAADLLGVGRGAPVRVRRRLARP